MKKFAVAYVGTTMPKYDRAEIRNDKVSFYCKDKLVYSTDVRSASMFHATQNLGIEFVEAENGEEAMRKVISKHPFMIRELISSEVEDAKV